MSDDLIQQVKKSVKTLSEATDGLDSALEERDCAIFEANQDGASAMDLAKLTGLSRQQVHKIIAAKSSERYGWTIDD